MLKCEAKKVHIKVKEEGYKLNPFIAHQTPVDVIESNTTKQPSEPNK